MVRSVFEKMNSLLLCDQKSPKPILRYPLLTNARRARLNTLYLSLTQFIDLNLLLWCHNTSQYSAFDKFAQLATIKAVVVDYFRKCFDHVINIIF